MVKKVGGKKPPGSGGPSKVEGTKAVESGKEVQDVGSVQAPAEQAKASRARKATRPMTSAERDHLFQLIQEEASKMFGPNGLPESQRATVEDAVRKTIDASIIDEE